MRTKLNVPYEFKQQVKDLGARWDPARKHWYVPDGVDLFPFLDFIDKPGLHEAINKPAIKKALNGHGRKKQS